MMARLVSTIVGDAVGKGQVPQGDWKERASEFFIKYAAAFQGLLVRGGEGVADCICSPWIGSPSVILLTIVRMAK
jgi:hypothetical protein